MRVLVTGITGFAGGHLAEALAARPNVELAGLSRRPWPVNLRHLAERARLYTLDLDDGSAVESVLREVRPERIFHLAGYANTGKSFHEPDQAWTGNLGATRSLYEAVVRWGGTPRILFVGSGLIYGDPPSPGEALSEESPLRPASPYAASKAAADLLSYQYTRYPGLDIVRVRPFNHVGPRQSADYAIVHFARQIAEIERGERPPRIETGSLDALRDLTDVRDMVEAYQLLADKGRTGEAYNAASGRVHAIGTVLDRLLNLARVQVEVVPQARLMHAVETREIRGDAGKLRRETGWSPRYDLDQTLQDTLDYWRSVR
jgi:GDP-4-dehydro-6-deoxy-D-mannose reductase